MKTIKFRKVLLLMGLVFMGTQVFAQKAFEIKVKLVKHENKTENHATATLLDAKTMEIVSENGSNENSEIVIENIQKGDYILMVQNPGYKQTETRFISIDENGITHNDTNNVLAEKRMLAAKIPAN
ncbi:MAG TPA: hypothetical protein VFC36_01485 [Paludibacter sp.]|nr:hypothetical protein [Paludibacter sp.]